MAQIGLSLPDEYLNKLNNFYLENFGYEIHTQLINFIYSELKKCEDYSTEKPEPFPKPRIRKQKDILILEVDYPDGTALSISGKTWENNIRIMNEWSKYGYDKNAKEKVMLKVGLDRTIFSRIRKNHDKYSPVKKIDGVERYFGAYNKLEDALLVRNFLEKHEWDMKYHSSRVIGTIDGVKQGTFSDYLYNIVCEDMGNVEK